MNKLSSITPDMTIAQAKEIMREEMQKGCICACCNQPVKIYRRSITSSMAYGLILLYNHAKKHNFTSLMHVENIFKDMAIPASIRADIPKLRFWGLIEPERTGKADGNPNSGWYSITEAGKNFVRGEATAMSHIWLYNNKQYGFPLDSKPITIEQALKNKFNYKELMK